MLMLTYVMGLSSLNIMSGSGSLSLLSRDLSLLKSISNLYLNWEAQEPTLRCDEAHGLRSLCHVRQPWPSSPRFVPLYDVVVWSRHHARQLSLS